MTEERKATRENQRVPFDMASCTAMLEEMMGQYEGVCDCAGIMGQGSYAEMMSQMMASCCGVQGEAEEEADAEATQKA
jgi:hypothetical protein